PRKATAKAKFSQLAQIGWPVAIPPIQRTANPNPISIGPAARLGFRSGSDSRAAVPNASTAATASNQSNVAPWFWLRPIHQKTPRAIPRMKQLLRTMTAPFFFNLATVDERASSGASGGGARFHG